MEKEYAIGIDLGGTSVKYALIDNEGVFYFQGKLPSKADVSAEAVIGQLVTAINEVKAFAQEQGYKINGIGIGTPGIVDSTPKFPFTTYAPSLSVQSKTLIPIYIS